MLVATEVGFGWYRYCVVVARVCRKLGKRHQGSCWRENVERRAAGKGGENEHKRWKRKKRAEQREENPTIYMTAVCLGRILMRGKGVVVIKGTR